MSLIDTHAHLDDPRFEADRDEVIARAAAAGVERIVCVGISSDTSERAVRLAERYDPVVAAVGIQPNSCGEASPGDWDRVVCLVEHPRVVAVGETGLDRYWDTTPFDIQEDYFDRHLQLARRRDLPVLIHCRDCEDDVLRMLRRFADGGPMRGLIHAFSGSAAMADECLAMGLFLSFAGSVSYQNKKFVPLREIAARVPVDRLLLETDSPYLVPHPLRGKLERNEPAQVALTAAALAELRDCPVDELSRQTTANARQLFGLS
ncbi:MAG TPA: TatD family hydrolase [Thermoguttaceae bacterium]|nr:TatD family hydrolase [Thermoguttaceae bacterium]